MTPKSFLALAAPFVTMLALASVLPAPAVLAAEELFLPLLVYRTGPSAPTGIPIANGLVDYLKLINLRDGGVGGVKIAFEECETGYNADRAMACYDRFKARAPLVINPYITDAAYRLLPLGPVDKIPVHTMGYGVSVAADGSRFPWMFNFPATYWSQAAAFVQFVAASIGGTEKLKGKKIVHLHVATDYGREANAILNVLAKKYRFQLSLLEVAPPGVDQEAVWNKIAQIEPDWILLSSFGVMTSTAIKSAAAAKFPMERLIGNAWSGSEADVRPAGDLAKGYTAISFHAAGSGFPLFAGLKRLLYDKGLGTGSRVWVGEMLYNRGLLNAVYLVEVIRKAQSKFSVRVPTGEQMRWALENLSLTEDRLADLGLANFTDPITVSCADHEGGGFGRFQQWDGKTWNEISRWAQPLREEIQPLLQAGAKKRAAKLGFEPRDCAKEG
jgi:branched-chain amino acid transport system substrate-binding protein